jgi:hypothetical protein
MNKTQKQLIEDTRKYLRATGDPELAIVAKYLSLGMCAYLKFLDTMGAAEKVTLPAGLKIKHIDFELTDEKDERSQGVMLAANWVGDVVSSALRRDAFMKAVSKVCCDPTLRPQEDPALAPYSEQVPYFGSDSDEEYQERLKATR